ncbi:E3 SUMO-protein ligase ZNF451 isoform X2 [Parambassis ranga]|uniref:E3 SUMO-protein ligase ZNF451 isoform X2 n=1 Tax=Parambassis ranga TaxID=210632 RepID=A0A6P7JT98_9TELE|nr:E3 SUMO-protein ligase ZNF451 isoform X2 [Parambassis ranga]
MSSPTHVDEDEVEDEVEFVSEGPIRPVLECIDLSSNSEDEGCSSVTVMIEDEITRHKARVASTLDRLAHQVAQGKKERADKCRAFKEKQILQKAHGQQELAFSATNGTNQEAKHCVDMWLKMPGLQPGVISSGSGRRRRQSSFPSHSLSRHTCPVINCDRVYENASLLDGHLKRFDHSPCDPSISLKGSPSELFACVACGQYFPTKEAWRTHLESKVSSGSVSHSIDQTYQQVVCFACPACYLLFNIRDECLQHMSAKNHFTESLVMNETGGRTLPVPVPQHVRNCLITLCKDVTFSVRCSLCHKVLVSHQAAQAHFNVHCRQGCAVAKADKTIVQVMKQFQVQGQCSFCSKVFLSQADIERHKESTQHCVEVNQTMAKALLQHCRFSEIQEAQFTSIGTSFQKRNKNRSDCAGSPAKRQRLGMTGSRKIATAWFCECGLQFSEEATASQHLLAVNQIFHQCGVCGKHMGESSITRLHMSRFHGGAHLSNFLFYCRKCKVEMPRHEDILAHVSEAHHGHTYFTEQEVPEELTIDLDAKPSTSSKVNLHSSSVTKIKQNAAEASSQTVEQTWMCRMCEDVFDSEAAVSKHCSDISSHSFQRFICGHCPQKFFKESTVRRHCVNEHDGQIKSSHFCGLCDSMPFESESEFLEHYKSLHSRDYYCMNETEVVQPAAAAAESTTQTCPCLGSEEGKGELKATYTRCMRNLSAEGKCQYVCTPCSVSVPSYAQMKTHVNTTHTALNLDKTFDVECKMCQESFMGVPSFHKHYHSQHCTLEPCMSSRTCRKDMKAESTTAEIKPENIEVEDETLVKLLHSDQANNEGESDDEIKHALSLSAEEARESSELEEALKRSLLEY